MMIKLFNVIIALIIIILLCLLANVSNIKKGKRIRQFFMIPISIVLIGFGIWTCSKASNSIINITKLFSFISSGYILIANIILFIAYDLVKFVIRPMVTAISNNKELLEILAFGIYEYDEEYSEWFVKKKWSNYRSFVFAVLCGCVFCGSLFLGLTWALGPESKIWIVMFPCAFIIVVNEIYGYLNGITKEEFEHSVMGDEIGSSRISNYYRLREVLENILPEPLLSANTGCEFIGKDSCAEYLEYLKKTKDAKDKIIADYFNINDRYKFADLDCVHATTSMMYRHNVVFFNPFYRDLGEYITLPLVSSLLAGKKCVVICGRNTIADDVIVWLRDLLKKYSHMKMLWRVDYLSDQMPECEVGVLTFNKIYDKKVINANSTFLNETDFVLMIEPSVMLNTSQVALSILANEMSYNNEKPVYCICDRNTDGLIDTLSHIIRDEITDVVAVPVPRCIYTAMSWNVDGDFIRQQLFDKQMKYLGNGIELASIAVKNQIPKVTWYSETKAPVRDIKWLSGQNYSTICRYMNLPVQQNKLYEKIDFIPNLWSVPKAKEQFVIVEDEFCNMFNMVKTFLTRGENQIFVNVLSENYLLRDYMRCNQQMFLSNPNAVPSYVPDYAKTERNTFIKLLIMMSIRPLSEDEVKDEFNLFGLESDDVYGSLLSLLKKYTFADKEVVSVKSTRMHGDKYTTVSSSLYSISDENFEKYFSDTLKNAYYILEDEKGDSSYIDSKMFGHVTQAVLPGQFVTYDGKYYMVKYVSPQAGVILRRASNMYDGRKYYRQVRTYSLENLQQCDIVSTKKVMDIDITELSLDFSVETSGYLEMSDYHDLRTARLIDFSQDSNIANYTRKYKNKPVLRIQLPNTDNNIRFTICLLLSEIFKSVYPDGWQYLAVVTKREDVNGMLNYVVYQTEGISDEEYIYIIEDSDIDLGLLTSIEKNFTKLMEIVSDFLDWHYDKMRELASKDPVPVKVAIVEEEVKKKRSLLDRMFDRIRKLFGGKKGKKEKVKIKEEPIKDVQPKDVEESNTTTESKVNKEEENKVEEKEYELGNNEEATSDNLDEDVLNNIDDTNSVNEASNEDVDISEKESDDNQNVIDLENNESTISEHLDDDIMNNIEDTNSTIETSTEAVDISKQDNDDNQNVTVNNDKNLEDEFEPTDDPDLVAIDGTDIFENEGMPEDNECFEQCFELAGVVPITKTRYQKECYLNYGFEEIDGRIQIEELRKYLRVRGWANNDLTKARKRDALVKTLLDVNAENHCDFCGLPLSGVSYEKLNDGRIRCNDCSSTAIKSLDEFKELFYRCLGLMEDFYNVKYRVPISVKTADAKTIGKQSGCLFKPTTAFAARVLGFAQKKKGEYSLIIENGSPRLASMDTMVHELTHIWQYLNWNDSQITQIYGMNSDECTAKAKLIIYEGMAVWASVQFLYQIGERCYAAQQEAMSLSRNDVYGIGFRLYHKQYPLVKDSSLIKWSPFATFPTLEPQDVYDAVKMSCTSNDCNC